MPALTSAQVLALAESLGLPVSPDDLAEVTHRLNAFADAIAALRELPLERVEPWPALPDTGTPGAEPAP
jgi:hypothetical protein